MEKRKEICLQVEMFSYQMFSFLFKRLYFIRVWSHNTYLRPLRILYPSRNNPYELPPSLSLNPLLPRVICALYKRNWWIVSLPQGPLKKWMEHSIKLHSAYFKLREEPGRTHIAPFGWIFWTITSYGL